MTVHSDGSAPGPGAEAFSEAGAWSRVGGGWRPLHGSVRGAGFSIEWHDFFAEKELDWAASFHPDCVELCLNLDGHGYVADRGGRTEFASNTAGFYHQKDRPLTARREADEQHRFLTVEFSCPFLRKHFGGMLSALDPVVNAALKDCPCRHVAGDVVRLSSAQLDLVRVLRHPPVPAPAQPLWYQCKALELAVTFLTRGREQQEPATTRRQRLAQERVEQVNALLKQSLAEPPSLKELGRKIGCSHFYLSRIFSEQTGRTISQQLRELRLERAAELLKSGEYNVTEAAFEVGYNSLSHFSAAFRETFGCCPGLYPIRLAATPVGRDSVEP
ncbi:MAG: AraC family transcriptional regulator [Verrucomicrobiota bacterium]